jgi:hypothetical protein
LIFLSEAVKTNKQTNKQQDQIRERNEFHQNEGNAKKQRLPMMIGRASASAGKRV